MQTCLLNSAFYSLINITPTCTEQCIHKHNTNHTIKNICADTVHNANYMQAFDHNMFITNTLTGSLQYDSVF